MKARISLTSKLLRLFLAFLSFVGALCFVLYLGFGINFEKPAPKANQVAGTPDHLFYKNIGAASPKLSAPKAEPSPQFLDKYTLELKVLNKQGEAEALVNELSKQGLKAYYTPFQSHGRVFYRVRQGLYSSKETAELQAKQMRLARDLPVTVIKLR